MPASFWEWQREYANRRLYSAASSSVLTLQACQSYSKVQQSHNEALIPRKVEMEVMGCGGIRSEEVIRRGSIRVDIRCFEFKKWLKCSLQIRMEKAFLTETVAWLIYEEHVPCWEVRTGSAWPVISSLWFILSVPPSAMPLPFLHFNIPLVTLIIPFSNYLEQCSPKWGSLGYRKKKPRTSVNVCLNFVFKNTYFVQICIMYLTY